MNNQTTDPKVKASVFSFFSTVYFFKIFLASRQVTHLVLPKRKSTLRKTKIA